MQLANILLSLGGDHGNTIPKFHVTAAEIAVLRAIHGEDAVKEVEPQGEIKRSHREERGRLIAIYGAAKTPDQKHIVEGMFPGVAARVFETLAELELDDEFFKATGRMKASDTPIANGPPPTIAEWVAAGYRASNYPPRGYEAISTPEEIEAAVAAEKAAAEVDEADEDVGEDINDEHAEKDILG